MRARRSLTLTLTATAALLGVAVGPAAAAPGDLDPSFGGDGIVGVPVTIGAVAAIAVQPDGRIVAVGGAAGAGGFDTALARLNPDGTLDGSFAGGVVQIDLGGNLDSATDVVLQPDGRILVSARVGTDTGAGRDFAVVRFLPDGRLDTSFGTAGRAVVDLSGDVDDAESLALQPDGRILVAGISGRAVAVLRLLPDGARDVSFGAGGAVRTALPGAFARDVAVQPDGRIVVGGGTAQGTSGSFAVLRYLADGRPDPGFGSGGVVTTDVGPSLEYVYALALQPDGKIVVTGPATPLDFVVARYEPDGDLDSAFGANGIVRTDFTGRDDIPNAIAVQPDGRIVVAGYASSGAGDGTADEDVAVVRYLPGGSLDPSFGTAGRVTTDTTGVNDNAQALALQPDGRILAGGSRFSVLRYLGSVTGGAAPSVAVTGGDCRGKHAASARLVLAVRDADTPAGALRLSATSSNPAVLPAGGLILGGSGEGRTADVSVTGRSGSATVTVTVDDGTATVILSVRVVVGTHGRDAGGGSPGTDLIFGLQGQDDLSGGAGPDVLCGGNGGDRLSGGDGADALFGQNGPDQLHGGAGPDLFSGGHGPDAYDDVSAAQGDSTDGS